MPSDADARMIRPGGALVLGLGGIWLSRRMS
jgi:hypothetical protein